MFHLHELGWTPFFQQHLKADDSGIPARVIEEQRASYVVACELGQLLADASGHLRHNATQRSSMPAVGDWVVIEPQSTGKRATIHEVLPRKSKFSRKAAGIQTQEQIVAANIDTVFVMTSLNAELNLRRIERYLATIWNSGAKPVVILSKADLCEDAATAIETIAKVAIGVSIHSMSSLTGDGIDQVLEHLKPGQTAALLGSSGVGKSTLINRLLRREAQKVRDIREDDAHGRHTTTARRLFILPGGGMLIDTPGMRELQLWDAEDGFSQTFEDILQFAMGCHFRDCGHESEPGCAVQEALSQRQLSAERFESYLKLKRELSFLERKQNVLARVEENRKWKRMHKAARKIYKNRDKP